MKYSFVTTPMEAMKFENIYSQTCVSGHLY